MKNIFTLLFAFFAFATLQLQAQATLSIQGTVQNSTGAAVTDGSYSLTFKLYTQSSGGSAIWTETQTGIPIQSGVYSAELGAVETLNVPFNATYFLGVSVDGGAVMAPRAKLTSAPYALSLRGQENVFGSTGPVGIGTSSPATDSKLHIKNGSGDAKIKSEGSNYAILELASGSNKNELITVPGGELEIKQNGAHRMVLHSGGATIHGDATVNGKVILNNDKDVELGTGGNIKYGTLNDWRLVDIDDFSTGYDGWASQQNWKNNNTKSIERIQPNSGNAPFSKGWLIGPSESAPNPGDSDDALYKFFDLNGQDFTQVKVVFTYHISGEYDGGEYGYGAFSTSHSQNTNSNNNGSFQVGWVHFNDLLSHSDFDQLGYIGSTTSFDYNVRAEMVANMTTKSFYVIIGAFTASAEALTDERYYISDVELWVK
jgi:hypothetical protein